MKNIIRQIYDLFSKIPTPLLLLIVCILTYGLLIPWLGFYLDDWNIIFFQKVLGGSDFSLYFKNDRPMFAYIYQIFVPIFRDSKLGWQLFALIAHTLAVITFWILLRKILPSRKTLVIVAAMFFAVYPGFQFHWFSVMYSQAYILNVFYFLSYIFMINAIQKKNRMLTVIAVFFLMIGIVPAENFFGIEIVRPIVIYFICFSNHRKILQNIKRTILLWLPYLLTIIGFLVYRLSFNKLFSYPVSILTELRNAPIQTFLTLIGEIFWSIVDSCIIAWTNLLFLLKREILTSISVALLLIILFGFVLSYCSLKNKIEKGENQSNNKLIILISLIAVISSMIPFIAGSFKITLDFPNNRYLLAIAPGAALFLASVIDELLRTRRQKLILISLIIGFSMGSQFIVARGFMNMWNSQQEFFWQLFWRAPSIKENTILVTEDLSFSKYFSWVSLTAPMNLIYAPGLHDHNIPYSMVLYSQSKSFFNSYLPNKPVEVSFRSFNFNGNTSSTLVFKKSANACLHIISRDEPADRYIKNQEDYFWPTVIPLSNPESLIINVENPIPPEKKLFGRENQNQWCYFYEKAELAGQQKKWQQVINLYSEAQNAGFVPLADTEWEPLINAFLKLGDYSKALEILNKVDLSNKNLIPGFCKQWEDLNGEHVNVLEVKQAMDLLNCP